ncbi:MAG: TIR domain-containing protein [Kiritimatiellae bacterium]|nr:TIR domain-containing protein [Kiritimatiellia bacterium]
METMHDIFISYSRRNLEAVKAIKAELEAEGFSCWMDLSGIPSGQGMFISTIVPAIRETKAAFLFFLTAESQASEWAMKEIGFAKGRARKRVVLVRINDDEMTDEFDFNYQFTDIIDWRVPEQKEKLLGDLRRWAGKEEKPAKTAEEKKADGDGGATKAPQPEPETLVHIDSDEDCTVWLFDKVVARMKAHEDRVLRLRKGKHKLAFVSMEHPDTRIEQVYEVAEGGVVDLIKVNLSEQRRRQEEAERMQRQKEKTEQEEARRFSGQRTESLRRSLVIGCGGAGIAAMEELHRMLALDAGTLREASEKVFYLAVDTDSSALERFRATLEETAEREGVRAPICQTVHLSKGVTTFREAVEGTALADGGGDPGRLRDHWWFDGEGHPFEAPRVRNLSTGTNKCPAVAYGLAWRGLETIENALDQIVRKALLRGGWNADPSYGVDIFVTAGLAGGTGRGCWNLVASKVRQHLEEKHCLASLPTGVFFGADVYADIARTTGGAGTDLAVNALTGVSELSGWLEDNRHTWSECDECRLPSPENPAAPDADVLNLNRMECPARGPVGQTFLICGRSRQATLPTSQDYHRMAGKALYAMISLPHLAARRVNGSDAYMSLAAATFAVDRPHIEAYCKALAREMVLDQMTAPAKEDTAAAVEDFLKEHPLNLRIRNAEELKPNPNGGPYQRMAWALQSVPEYKSAFGEMCAKLKSWTLDDAMEHVRRLAERNNEEDHWEELRKSRDRIIRALKEALNGFWGRHSEDDVEKAARKAAEGAGGGMPSAQRALDFLSGLRLRIYEALDDIPDQLEMATDATDGEMLPYPALQKTLKKYSERTFLEIARRIRAFNADECRKLCCDSADCASLSGVLPGREGGYWGVVPMAVTAMRFPEMKAVLKEAFSGTLERIRELARGLEKFLDICREARADFAREPDVAAEERPGDDGFQELFATPDRIEETLYSPGDPERLFHRVLKPIVEAREEVERIVAGEMIAGRKLRAWFDRVWTDGTLEALAEERDGARKEAVGKELRETIRVAVGLPTWFMENHFSFPAVLAKNLPYWNRVLEDAWNGSDSWRWEELAEKFRATLGETSEPNSRFQDGPPQLPPARELLATIAVSMAATCVPWWMVDLEARHGHSAMVFVPFAPDSKDEERMCWASRLMDMSHLDIFGLGTGLRGGEGTPFACVAYAEEGLDYGVGDEYSHPLDHVRSLDDWKNPKVRRWLQLAEREDGASIFSEEDGNPGLGYVSPWFVRDRAMSSHRWKPWAEKRPE